MSSPVVFSSGTYGSGSVGGFSSAGGDNFDIYGGIDPSLDPELAMAIRVSTEEARAQEEARLKALEGQARVPISLPQISFLYRDCP